MGRFLSNDFHFNYLASRRYDIKWNDNSWSLKRKILGRIGLILCPYFFDDSLPNFRRYYRVLTSALRPKPNTFILSPIKAGSSSIGLFFANSKYVNTSVVKEFELSSPKNDRLYFPIRKNNINIYVAPFMIARSDDRFDAIDVIKKHYSKGKVIFILRDPISRFISHYKWEYFLLGREGVAENKMFNDINTLIFYLKKMDYESMIKFSGPSGFPLIKSGLYHKILKDFSHQGIQYKVFDFDEVVKKGGTKEILDYLGIYKNGVGTDLPKVNENLLKIDTPLDEDSLRFLNGVYSEDWAHSKKYIENR
ncbi:MAG: hypothetical protein ACMVP2_06170 [Imperialibacter sp.]|uniref:hypothetical protein n=1 Tax=Imperialibacter sp. TaxID=2038411 RepID=UPI003A861AB5